MKSLRFLALACVVAGSYLVPASAQPAPNVNPAFLGAWCAQGDPTRRASIVTSGLGLQLTNETGSTSDAQTTVDASTIVALQWNLVNGTLSGDGSRINWSNNTFWNRCPQGRGGTLDGTWYASGDRNLPCSIRQNLGGLNFKNETGVAASGSFDGPRHLTATWSGVRIGGTVNRKGSRIDWDNGTFWAR